MQEKIQQFTQKAVANKKISIGLLVGLTVLVGGLVKLNMPTESSLALVGATSAGAVISNVEVAVVGATSTTDISNGGASWPGELISLGSVPVQPAREGTISAWNVHIGQKVYAGEVLGMLSQPPAMPDTVAMVADEAKMLAMARVNADAKRAYATERIGQLEDLRANVERSLATSRSLRGVSGSENTDSTNFSMVEAKEAAIRAMLRGSIAKTYLMLSGSATLPTRWSSVSLSDAIGSQNSILRNDFQTVFFAALKDLDDNSKPPITSGLAFFDITIKLVDASVPDEVTLTDATLVELKSMLHDDQEAFIMAVDKLRETELMAVDAEKMAFEQLRMIDNDIAMLKQDLAMADGDVAAKEISYKTVRGGVLGSSAIISPKSGIVSSIAKRVGEFVGPGMPVAVVTGENGKDEIVRFRIPSNVRKPEIGAMFHVTRPGFPEIMPKVKLIGVGSSLDETGSVMADAIFLEPVDWPIGISLRVVSGADTETIEIPLSSIWWDAGANPNVWAVSSGGRLYAKTLSLGRTLGEKIEVYGGLSRGDSYIVKPAMGIVEDMLLDDIKASDAGQKGESSYDAAMRAMGM